MNKTFSKIISFFLVGTLALSLAACAENADAMKAKDTPDYATTLSNFETHQTAYSEFMNAGDGNIFYKQTEGFTPLSMTKTIRRHSRMRWMNKALTTTTMGMVSVGKALFL